MMRSPGGRACSMWLRLRGPRSRCRPARMRMRPGLVALAAVITIPAALTAANTVEVSRAGQRDNTATPNDVKPSDCASITLASLYKGTNAVTGGTTNDLILGGAAAQTLDGGDGNDCILGGEGDDQLGGGPGTDVCIGGPGVDTFGADCETAVQGDATF